MYSNNQRIEDIFSLWCET